MPSGFGALSDPQVRAMLGKARRIAVVGLSPRPARPSYGVAAYLLRQGYTIYPVNPTAAGQTILGCRVYRSLAELPHIIVVFRQSQHVPAVIEDAIAARAALQTGMGTESAHALWVVWTQLGVINEAAAARAHEQGFPVIQDRCLKVEHARLLASL